MRVAFLIHSLESGGAERFTATLANHWRAAGHEVLVITMTPPRPGEYALNSGICRHSLDLAGASLSVRQALLRNAQRILAIRRILRKWRPDAAIGIMATASILLAFARPDNQTVLIGTERVHPPLLPLDPIWERLRPYAYGALDGVVAQTERSAAWIRRNTHARHVPVIGNPISLPLSRAEPSVLPTSALGPAGQRKLALCVGRLTPQKQFHRAIEAFASLSSCFEKWDLAILGEGPLRAPLMERAAQLGVQDRVIFPGFVGNLADWYERADVFLLTSAFEGFPNALVEAMAHGVAVISFDCETGPREIVRPGIDGMLVAQNDQEALLDALNLCFANDAMRTSLCANAREVLTRLSIDGIAAQWEIELCRCQRRVASAA